MADVTILMVSGRAALPSVVLVTRHACGHVYVGRGVSYHTSAFWIIGAVAPVYVRSGMCGAYRRMCPVRAPVPANAALRRVAWYNFILLTQSWLPRTRFTHMPHALLHRGRSRKLKNVRTKYLLGGLQLISGAIKIPPLHSALPDLRAYDKHLLLFLF